MVEIIRMPAILAGAEEAAVQSWLVAPGDTIAQNQPIAEIETDKASVEMLSEVAGVVGRLLVPQGDSVAVGDPIFVMLAPGDAEKDIDGALAAIGLGAPTTPPLSEPEPASATLAAAPTTSSDTTATHVAEQSDDGQTRRLFATPIVRRLAAQHGVALSDVQGTGPHGRIVRRDFETHLAQLTVAPTATSPAPAQEPSGADPAAAAPSSAAAYEDIPLDRMRKAIARRLTESKSTVPHFYLVADCRVDELMDLRTTVNQTASRKISVNDFVVKAVGAALMEVSQANATWNGDSIRQFSSADVSVAVATAGGLTTPVLRGIERMSLTEVSATIAEMADRARSGRLKQHELEGGSFSVSNLGMYGTSQFSAILNPPQAGILAVGAARSVPAIDSDGALSVGKVMTVTLSADHRVLDGAVAAQWLAAFQRRIENPLTILI
ncbi:dihydrolipoamide acetyltransferase family protein [Microbacterium sp. LWH11-1.2]|uniref:dihydrolipoamide acetyltransferase family protein n=1 Tax=unclassified Microbacterium TaxID=2609290 RepID=UPI003139B041